MLKNKLQLVANMGLRYTIYRILLLLEVKFGVLKKRHPLKPTFIPQVSLIDWQQSTPPFFFNGNKLTLEPQPHPELKKRVDLMKSGEFVFFSKQSHQLGVDYDWVTNPITGYQYNVNQHWSTIPDFSPAMGDIKFVWEKARFSFLTDVLRYDFHFKEDQSEFVFSQIMDFIAKNPINGGPNYRCSQEISLRIMNWTLALNYYKNSLNLTQERFQTIMYAIYWQLHHVYHHINFSRIAVRNNHAITETLMLYLGGLLFPFLPDSKEWSKNGKKWFEAEIAYQIYPDGTFLQFSMNYHRVAVQLLTWGLRLADLHNDKLNPIVKERAERSLEFLDACSDPVSGQLPNYGNNDGALFFRWTADDYRVYTSQLNDLRAVLQQKVSIEQESQAWYGLTYLQIKSIEIEGIHEFKNGGYYIAQEGTVKIFLRCGAYKDRPSQSDNLHLDIWKDGVNYLWDTGTYKYNTEKSVVDFFTGTEGHNTLAINGANQMLRGSRFIWYYWVKKVNASMKYIENKMIFDGQIEAFQYVEKGIIHRRQVEKMKAVNQWKIIDSVTKGKGLKRNIYWHINPAVAHLIEINCVNEGGQEIKPLIEEKWMSSYYGIKEISLRYTFTSKQNMITTINLK